MGQIVLRNQDYTYCNLQAIQAGGSQANTVLDLGEVWIVDSTNASKTNGSGKYDKYIVGDGSTAAKNLTIRNIDDDSSLDIWVEDYSKQYFTTIARENGIISFNIWKSMGTDMINSISYSTDNGRTWNTTNNTNNKSEHLTITVNVNEGDKVLWKGDATQLGYYDSDDYTDIVGSFFSSTCEFDAQGNVMSLLYDDNFKGEDTLEYKYQFACLFFDYNGENECKVVNARNLSLLTTTLASNCYCQMFKNCANLITAPVLPATTLANSCYADMFHHCTSLTTAPELPATTLAVECYAYMFNGCTNLNSITCLATDISVSNCTEEWVYNVAATGTFIKADNANWSTGVNGIPEGWNVYTESEYEVVRHYELNESELAISAALNDLNSRVSLTEITWAELKELRDNSNLVPGKQYRITDYVATIDSYVEPNARSANHQFDIIVTADSVNKLNEQARAIQHAGDAYFTNSNLETWELKYQLDNVKWSKQKGTYVVDEENGYSFLAIGTIELSGHTYQLLQGLGTYVKDWSDYALMDSLEEGETIYCYYGDPEDFDPEEPEEVGTASAVDVVTEEGKGTILWMKDDWGNECPYDFKNIQFKRWKATDAQSGRIGLNNLYMVASPDGPAKNLSVSNTEDYIWAYTFSSDNSGGDQTDFSLGGHNVHDNVFKPYGDLLPNNVMFGGDNYGNSFGLNCYYNSWGNSCSSNSWGNNCYNNSWGNGCYYNSWGNYCYNNSWGNFCQNNSWGNGCNNNSWGNECRYNSWGNDCDNNSWGNYCYYNSWGNSCQNNSWGNSCNSNSWGNEVTYSTVFDGVQYTQITTTKVKYVQVLNGVQGTSSSKLTLTFAANKTYTQVAAKTSAGALKIYVPGDLA